MLDVLFTMAPYAAEIGLEVYDRRSTAEAERRADEARRRRNDRIAVGATGLAALGLAALSYWADRSAEPRLSKTYLLGYTDTAGSENARQYEYRVARMTADVTEQRMIRRSRHKLAAFWALLAVVAASIGFALTDVRWIIGGVVLLATSVWLLMRAGRAVPDPVFPPPPVVFPSAPKKSAAAELLHEAERKRNTLDQMVERLLPKDPIACYLLIEAKHAGETAIEEAAVNHELIRWDVVDSRGLPEQSAACEEAHAMLESAVAQYAELVPLANKAATQNSRAAVESLAKRTGLEALIDAGEPYGTLGGPVDSPPRDHRPAPPLRRRPPAGRQPLLQSADSGTAAPWTDHAENGSAPGRDDHIEPGVAVEAASLRLRCPRCSEVRIAAPGSIGLCSCGVRLKAPGEAMPTIP